MSLLERDRNRNVGTKNTRKIFLATQQKTSERLLHYDLGAVK